MIVFTTLEHLRRRGVPGALVRRYGRDYEIVLITTESIEKIRELTPGKTGKRLVGVIPSRHDIVAWLRENDTTDIPWPRYAVEGLED